MQNELKLNFDKIISLNNFSDSQKKIKQENFNNYFEKGLPNKRNEDWKFSDINQIISKNFDNLNFIVDQKKVFEEKDFPLDFEHNKISFVDGKLHDFDFKHEDKDKILVDHVTQTTNPSCGSLRCFRLLLLLFPSTLQLSYPLERLLDSIGPKETVEKIKLGLQEALVNAIKSENLG